MVRFAHRTVLARVVAFSLVAFALSPVTAPFTTCDLSDFAQSHPTDTGGHHPGRQMAVPHKGAAAHVITMAFAFTAGLPIHAADGGRGPTYDTTAVHTRHDFRTVLRL